MADDGKVHKFKELQRFSDDVSDWFKVAGSVKRASNRLAGLAPAYGLSLKITPVQGRPGMYELEWSARAPKGAYQARDAMQEDRKARKERQAEQDKEAAERRARQAQEHQDVETPGERVAREKQEARSRAAVNADRDVD